MRGRFVLAALLAPAALMLTAGSSWAAAAIEAYPPPPVGLQVSTGVTSPGDTIQLTGEGCPAGSTVRIDLDTTSDTLATTVANAEGTFSVPLTIPLTTALGHHTVVATCRPVSMPADLDIVPNGTAGGATSHGPLPTTGFDARVPLLAGLALIVGGSAAVLVARTRRRRRAA